MCCWHAAHSRAPLVGWRRHMLVLLVPQCEQVFSCCCCCCESAGCMPHGPPPPPLSPSGLAHSFGFISASRWSSTIRPLHFTALPPPVASTGCLHRYRTAPSQLLRCLHRRHPHSPLLPPLPLVVITHIRVGCRGEQSAAPTSAVTPSHPSGAIVSTLSVQRARRLPRQEQQVRAHAVWRHVVEGNKDVGARGAWLNSKLPSNRRQGQGRACTQQQASVASNLGSADGACKRREKGWADALLRMQQGPGVSLPASAGRLSGSHPPHLPSHSEEA